MDRPDGRLNAWILAWDAHALRHAPARLFDAPVFHPLPDALAFSENLLLPAIAGGARCSARRARARLQPARCCWRSSCPGLGVQLLVRRVTGDRLAAFVAGAIFAVGAHRWIRLAHLHAQVTLFLPLALLALDRFWERRTLARARCSSGLLLALQGLALGLPGAITAWLAAVGVRVRAAGGLRRPRARASCCAACAGRGAARAGRAAVPAHARLPGHGVERWRTWRATRRRSSRTRPRARGCYGTAHAAPPRPGARPGHAVPGPRPAGAGDRGAGAGAAALSRGGAGGLGRGRACFSLGPQTAVYRFLHEHVVLVRGMRALSRFSLIPVLALCVLTGLALAGAPAAGAAGPGAVPGRVVERAHPLRALRRAARGRALAGGRAGRGRRPAAGRRRHGGHARRHRALAAAAERRLGLRARGPTRARWSCSTAPIVEEALRFLRAVGVTHVVPRLGRRAEACGTRSAAGELRPLLQAGRRRGTAAVPRRRCGRPDGVILDLGARASWTACVRARRAAVDRDDRASRSRRRRALEPRRRERQPGRRDALALRGSAPRRGEVRFCCR